MTWIYAIGGLISYSIGLLVFLRSEGLGGARPALAVLSDFDFPSDATSDNHALGSQVFTLPFYNSVQVGDSGAAAAAAAG